MKHRHRKSKHTKRHQQAVKKRSARARSSQPMQVEEIAREQTSWFSSVTSVSNWVSQTLWSQPKVDESIQIVTREELESNETKGESTQDHQAKFKLHVDGVQFYNYSIRLSNIPKNMSKLLSIATLGAYNTCFLSNGVDAWRRCSSGDEDRSAYYFNDPKTGNYSLNMAYVTGYIGKALDCLPEACNMTLLSTQPDEWFAQFIKGVIDLCRNCTYEGSDRYRECHDVYVVDLYRNNDTVNYSDIRDCVTNHFEDAKAADREIIWSILGSLCGSVILAGSCVLCAPLAVQKWKNYRENRPLINPTINPTPDGKPPREGDPLLPTYKNSFICC